MRDVGRTLVRRPASYVLVLTLIAISAVVAVSAGRAQDGGPGLDRRVPFGGSNFPLGGEVARTGTPSLERVFQNLTFNSPLFLTSVPGTDPEMLAVVEQDGRVIIFPNDPNTTQSRVLLDITNRVGQGGANERGLLGLAFDPKFTENGFLYVYYTGPGASNFTNQLERYQVASQTNLQANANTRCQLFSFTHPQSNHNGGWLAFDQDGFLYLSVGDGGGANDRGAGHNAQTGNGQDLNTMLGKILRVRPLTNSTTTCEYSTTGNPFSNAAGNADQGGMREIFTLGNRHTWRCSFDKQTDDLWCGDVGQNAREEVDLVTRATIDAVLAGQTPAVNFGWACREGLIAGPIQSAGCDGANERMEPVFDYVSGNQASVIGGYLYRGREVPQLQGMYVFGNFGDQLIGVLDPSRKDANGRLMQMTLFRTAQTGGRIWSMGEDRQGELYALFGTSNQIRKVVLAADPGVAQPAAQGATEIPPMLSQTGLFADTAGLVLAPGVVPYDVKTKLFSDNLEKMRAFAVPGTGKITFDAMGRFDFPMGSVFLKHFEQDGRRIETRFLFRGEDQWFGVSYEWLPDQRDAVLVGEDLKTIQLPNGQMYDLPSRADCQACHNRGMSNGPLQIIGFQARQLNFPIEFKRDANSGGSGAMDNQLRALNAVGFFDRDIGDVAQMGLFPQHPTPMAEIAQLSNEELNRRARSFFESNCAICHRPGGNTPSPIDLQFDTPNAATLIFNQPPGEGSVDEADRVVDAGNPDNSVVVRRMMRLVGRDEQGMPPISHRQIDELGVALIREWISRAIDADGNPKP